MFDFPMKEASVWTSLYCFIVFWIILWTNYSGAIKYPFMLKVNKKKQEWANILIAFFFITHCLNGDFFHFMEDVHEYVFIPGYYNYGEEVFQIIAKIVDKNYFLLRVIVWGGAFVLFCWTTRRFNVPVYYTVVFLFATHSITFSYARATAAMAVYFFGLSFLCRPIEKFKWLGYVLGIFIIYLSWNFHNSALIMLVMTGMILVPLRKWIIIAVIFMIPSLSVILKEFLFIFVNETTSDILARKINSYSERELNPGIAAKVISLFEYLSFYIPFIISTFRIFKKQNFPKVSSEIIKLYKVMFGLTLASTTFYFLGESFITFFYRILFMTMIPISIIVVNLRYQGLMTQKQFYYCFLPGVIFLLLKYLYNIYLNLLTS